MNRRSTGDGHVRRNPLLDVGGELARPRARMWRSLGPARDAAANWLEGPAYACATPEMADALMFELLQMPEAIRCGRSPVRPHVT